MRFCSRISQPSNNVKTSSSLQGHALRLRVWLWGKARRMTQRKKFEPGGLVAPDGPQSTIIGFFHCWGLHKSLFWWRVWFEGSSGTFLRADEDKSRSLEAVEEKMARATMIPRINGEVCAHCYLAGSPRLLRFTPKTFALLPHGETTGIPLRSSTSITWCKKSRASCD